MTPTIAWDVDDVLNDVMRRWLFDCWKPAHSEHPIAFEDIDANPPHGILAIPVSAYLNSLDAYRLSGAYAALEPLPEVLSWFKSRGAHFNHLAVTSVPLSCAHVSAEWVMRHFSKWMRSFNVVPSKREAEPYAARTASKGEFLTRFRAIDLFIDDSAQNVAEVRSSGIPAVLFPRPWNKAEHSVADLLTHLDSLLPGSRNTPRRLGMLSTLP